MVNGIDKDIDRLKMIVSLVVIYLVHHSLQNVKHDYARSSTHCDFLFEFLVPQTLSKSRWKTD